MISYLRKILGYMFSELQSGDDKRIKRQYDFKYIVYLLNLLIRQKKIARTHSPFLKMFIFPNFTINKKIIIPSSLFCVHNQCALCRSLQYTKHTLYHLYIFVHRFFVHLCTVCNNLYLLLTQPTNETI